LRAGGALAAAFPDSVPAITVDRCCASSLSGAISIARASAPDELLQLKGAVARSVEPEDRFARVDALERLLRAELKHLVSPTYADRLERCSDCGAQPD
jgi:hypothetical protein